MTVIRGNVAAQLGLGMEDVSVFERGFREVGGEITSVIAVRPANFAEVDVPIVIAEVNENNGSCLAWRTSVSGLVEATARVGRTAGLGDNESRAFETVKAYFTKKSKDEDRSAKVTPLSAQSPVTKQPTPKALEIWKPQRTVSVSALPVKQTLGVELCTIFSAPWILPIIVMGIWMFSNERRRE